MSQIHLIIKGHVQGVAYRAHTQKVASNLKLTGWVRNLPDGSVEVLAEGAEDALEQLVAWCHQGPARAQVAELLQEKLVTTGEFEDFRILF